MSTGWPYAEDGVKRDEFAESLRLPLVNTTHPRWCYITAVVVNPDRRDYPWIGIRPSDDELRVVASFHQEYVAHWYHESWKRRMAERPFDLDGQANGRYLIKYPHGGWGYRLMTWTAGPPLVPGPRDEPMGLLAVLDRVHQWGSGEPSPRWQKWKADHADVFAAVAR